jgi:hypothetical protein
MRKTIHLIFASILLIGIAGCHEPDRNPSQVSHTPTPMNPAAATVTFTPVVIPASTSTATLFPTRPPTATPEVLVNGLHQLRLSSVGLTFSYPPEIVRGYSLQEQHVVLRFGLRNAAFIVVAKPRHGYSLEDIARSPHLVNGSFASGPTPTPIAATRIRQFLIDGNPAARVDLNKKTCAWVLYSSVTMTMSWKRPDGQVRWRVMLSIRLPSGVRS